MLPFKIHHLDHIVIRVKDLERSIAFYRDVVGCSVDRRREDLGMVHMRAGTSMIDLLDVNGPSGRKKGVVDGPHSDNVDHFCLRIDPFDEEALLKHLQLNEIHNVEPVRMRYGAEGTGPSVYFHDPDGNQIEFKGPSGSE